MRPILASDASTDSTGKMVRDMGDDEWESEIRTNLFGPFYCCREFIRAIAGSARYGGGINRGFG